MKFMYQSPEEKKEVVEKLVSVPVRPLRSLIEEFQCTLPTIQEREIDRQRERLALETLKMREDNLQCAIPSKQQLQTEREQKVAEQERQHKRKLTRKYSEL
jgi:hypothetical protein